jgi:hypothetical protein
MKYDLTDVKKVRDDLKSVGVRQWIFGFLIAFLVAAEVLLDYVRVGFDPTIFTDPVYWIDLGIAVLSVILLAIWARDFARDKESASNAALADYARKIDAAHQELVNRDLIGAFNEYVDGINAANKLKAYVAWVNYRIIKAKKEKKRKKYEALLATAEADILALPCKKGKIKVGRLKRVRYMLVRADIIFSTVKDGGDDDPLNADLDTAGFISRRVFPLVGFALVFGSLFLDDITFDMAYLVKTFFKLFRIIAAIYAGLSEGADFVKNRLTAKTRNRLDFIQRFAETQKIKTAAAQPAPEPQQIIPQEVVNDTAN